MCDGQRGAAGVLGPSWYSHGVVHARDSKKQAAVEKGLFCKGQCGGRGTAQGKVGKLGMEFGFGEGRSGEPRQAKCREHELWEKELGSNLGWATFWPCDVPGPHCAFVSSGIK